MPQSLASDLGLHCLSMSQNRTPSIYRFTCFGVHIQVYMCIFLNEYFFVKVSSS